MFVFLPEIYLFITLLALIVAEVTFYGEARRPIVLVTPIGLGAALLQVLILVGDGWGLNNLLSAHLVIDSFAIFFKLFFIGLALLVSILTFFSKEISEKRRCEYHCFIVAAALGMCLVSSAVDLIVLFLALQMINILVFFLVAYRKDSVSSNQAGTKYLLFSAVSSALLLYAVALLYSQTQSFNLSEISRALAQNPIDATAGLVVFGLTFLALSFYWGSFPFFLWVSDVLDGAPTPSSVFVALGVPATGFAVGTRFFNEFFGRAQAQPLLGGVDWVQILALAAGFSMLVGSLMAACQKSIKRLAAHLVVFHSGFFLMGYLVLRESEGLAVILFNQVVDLFSLVGFFVVVAIIFNRFQSDRLEYYKQSVRFAFLECVFLLVFLGAFVGLPPFPSFFGRFALINAVVQGGWYLLACVAILSMVLATLAFSRVAYAIAAGFQEVETSASESNETLLQGGLHRAFLGALLIPVVLLGLWSEQLLSWGRAALFH